MTNPEPDDTHTEHDPTDATAPPVSPAYATPPPEGLPDAETQ